MKEGSKPRLASRRRLLRHGAEAALAGLGLALAGCVRLPGRGSAPVLYRLLPAENFGPGSGMAGPPVSWQLAIAEPEAAGGLGTSRIALEPSAQRLEYYAHARWVERTPELVRSLLVRSFEHSGRVRVSGRGPAAEAADFLLKSEIVEFAAVYSPGSAAPVVHVRLDVRFVAHPSGRILAARSFAATMPTADDRMGDIAAAFKLALQNVLGEIVAWTLQQGPTA